ncbi:glutamate racemase [Candidatus Uhrbacteria bacterium]|nr:glutamate racemase [Candidatus Uhrbacteria bacterium]
MTIGIFDSGLGGLTVAKAVMAALPREKIIYFGDTARTPYGNKPPETVAGYALQNAKFLLKKKAQMIVVGCNTASAVSGLALRKEFPSVPIFEVITPAVREALRRTHNGRIGVIGTRTTVQSGAYQKWCRGINARECPLFVPLVEAGRLVHPTTYEVAEQYLAPFQRAQVDTLILGCTHYPWLKGVIADIVGNRVQLVDSAETVAREVQQFITPPASPYLKGRNDQSDSPLKVRGVRGVMSAPKHEFYVSKKTPKFQELAEKWLGMSINLKAARL